MITGKWLAEGQLGSGLGIQSVEGPLGDGQFRKMLKDEKQVSVQKLG